MGLRPLYFFIYTHQIFTSDVGLCTGRVNMRRAMKMLIGISYRIYGDHAKFGTDLVNTRTYVPVGGNQLPICAKANVTVQQSIHSQTRFLDCHISLCIDFGVSLQYRIN